MALSRPCVGPGFDFGLMFGWPWGDLASTFCDIESTFGRPWVDPQSSFDGSRACFKTNLAAESDPNDWQFWPAQNQANPKPNFARRAQTEFGHPKSGQHWPAQTGEQLRTSTKTKQQKHCELLKSCLKYIYGRFKMYPSLA